MASQPQTNQYYWQPARLVHLDSGHMQQQPIGAGWCPKQLHQVGGDERAAERDGRLLLAAASISGHSVSVASSLTQQQRPIEDNTWPSKPGNAKRASEQNLARHFQLANTLQRTSYNNTIAATTRQREQQGHRKRRRHRSSQAPKESPPLNSGHFVHEAAEWRHPNQQQAPISAHCWLMDSSDEQSLYAAGQPRKLPRREEKPHLTVAMKQQHQRQLRCATLSRQAPHLTVGSSQTLHSTVPSRRIVAEGSRSLQRIKANSRSCQALQSRSSSNVSLSAGSTKGRHASSHAGASVVRLTALLSMVSNLVRRTPRLLGAGSSGGAVAQSGSQPQAARSVSGSLAPYTAGSLAVSSSSSSSAYATGSSSQPSSHHHLAYLSASATGAVPPPISLAPLRQACRPTSSLRAPSWHAYEYCDETNCDAIHSPIELEHETRFTPQPKRPCQLESDPESEARQSEGSSSCSGRSPLETMQHQSSTIGRQLPTASDHELISAGSDTRTGATFVEPLESQRGRWCWLKGWLRHQHQHCPTGRVIRTSSSSQDDRSPPQPLGHAHPNSDTRYKSLHSSGSGGPILQNVISLAKADRVFRLRLVASLLVTFLLIVLLALLGHMLYMRRSIPFYSGGAASNGRLSLLVDDSDFDLSWLWPQAQPGARGNRLEPALAQNQHGPFEAETTLRKRLAAVERGTKVEQFHLTVSHLTNIQLATDAHLDLSQLAPLLLFEGQQQQANNSSESPATSSTPQKSPRLSQRQLELASLVLLSNLDWPLVKWRHQNQQALANFFSFSLSTSAAQVSGGQPSTMRNLLALLIFVRELDESEPHFLAHLAQFKRLDTLLSSVAQQIISCSYELLSNSAAPIQQPPMYIDQTVHLEAKLCRLILSRYRRMMATLASLNYSHLSRLHDSLMLEHQHQDRSAKTLLGFLLDRLALLEPQSLAEAVLAGEDLDLAEGELAQSKLLDSLLLRSSMSLEPQTSSSDDSTGDGLLELTKRLVGEDLTRLDVDLTIGKSKTMEDNGDNSDTINDDLVYPWSSSQLPTFATPISYDLFFQPNLTTRQMVGMAKVSLKVDRATRFLVLHSSNLNLIELSLWLKSPVKTNLHTSAPPPVSSSSSTNQSSQVGVSLVPIPIRRVISSGRYEQIYVELAHQLEPFSGRKRGQPLESFGGGLQFGELAGVRDDQSNGEGQYQENVYLLSVSFNKTNIGQDEPGLEFVHYYDYFAQPEAELKTLLYTQLEPTGARHLFPCFDEPHLRAIFQLNLVHERRHQVLFNAAKRERVPYSADGGIQMSVFEPTPIPLSSYLICFVVCDGQNIKSITSRVPHLQHQPSSQIVGPTNGGHIQVQIMAQFEHLSQAEFASHLVPKLLAFYQTQLQLDYPLDKLDLLAIPAAASSSSLAIGGGQPQTNGLELDTVENLGLIWFKSPLLLLDTNLISQDIIEQIAGMISHQLAHQYFGNIVSVRRWQDRGLFEALCQYLESSALSRVQADWRLDEQFTVATIQETLANDNNVDWDKLDWLAYSHASPDEATLAQEEGEEEDDGGGSLGQENIERLLEAGQLGGQSLEPIGRGVLTATRPGQVELKKSGAILHMLLFNLLPSQEAQTRLLRRCLALYQRRPMSSQHFWRQFGHQLALDGSMDRTLLDLSKFQSSASNSPEQQETVANIELGPEESERVVFVHQRANGASHQDERATTRASPTGLRKTGRLIDSLELVADVWSRHSGYPLVTATVYRDRVHLRQEPFSLSQMATTSSDDNGEQGQTGAAEQLVLPELNKTQRRDKRQSKRARRHPGSPSDRHESSQSDQVWPIPLMFVSRANPKWPRFVWLDKRELELPLGELAGLVSSGSVGELESVHLRHANARQPSIGWFKLNVNQSSLVRVNYDDRNWEALSELLVKSHYSNHMLSQLDRANLIDDALSLMRCGRLSVGIAMNLTIYLEVGERDYMPWTSALRHLDQMQTLLNQNPLWHRYVLKLVQPISSVIGWKDDGPHLMRKLRRLLFSVALQYGDERTVSKAKQEFKNWVRSNRYIVPNLQELAYVAGVRYGDQQEWFYCWQKYQQLVGASFASSQSSSFNQSGELFEPALARSTGLPSQNLFVAGESSEPNAENEKRQLLTALASTQNTWLLEQFLNYTLDATKIQPRHLKHVVQTLGKNPVARLYLWRFVRLNWAALLDKHIQAPRLYKQILETMILEATKHFATKLDLDEVKSFFDAKRKLKQSSNAIEVAFRMSLRVIRFNIYWRDNIELKLTKWLSNYNGIMIN